MDLELDGTRALVHAASAGLGRAAAGRLATEGARVVITSRDADRLDAARDAICDLADVPPDRVEPVVCDLSRVDDIDRATEAAIDRFGGLDVLVTNHGGTPVKPFADCTLDDFDDAYEYVLRSTVRSIQAALPALTDGGGSIVNVVAASVEEPTPNHVVSGTLRAGIYALSKCLATDYADEGVRVNCACPRGVLTDRVVSNVELLAETEGVSVEDAEALRTGAIPQGRFGDPAEFADAVAYLASPRASYVTGETLSVDGGWLRGIM